MIDTNELRMLMQDFKLAGSPMFVQTAQMGELLDRLEAAEKERAWHAERCEDAMNECDALRTAVRHESDCVEAAKTKIKALRTKNAGLVDDMNLLRDNNTALRARIEQLERQEPVATVIKEGDSRYWMSERLWTFPDGKYPLYALPGAQTQGEEK